MLFELVRNPTKSTQFNAPNEGCQSKWSPWRLYAYFRDVRITHHFWHICLGIFFRAGLHKNSIPLLYTHAKCWIDLFLQGCEAGHLTAGQPHMPENKLGQSQFSWVWNQGDDYQVFTFWHWVLKASALEFSNMLNSIEFRLRREKKGWFNCRDFNMWFQKVCIFHCEVWTRSQATG